MRVGCLQFAPRLKDVEWNRRRCSQLIEAEAVERGSLSLLILPEMCFTGYTFKDKEDIMPLAEDEQGETIKWAVHWAKRLRTFIQLGYPRKHTARDGSITLYNSVSLVSRSGEVIYTYDKHFLYELDERWAAEGTGFLSIDVPPFGKVGPGICMDVNPYRFEAPFEAFEFATFHKAQGTEMVICSNAWLMSEGVDERSQDVCLPTIRYWATRMSPLIDCEKALVFVVANRTGAEGGEHLCHA
ncbi:protein N-terminal amidase Nta1 [Fimicolochytrium jonesii]|uniref:protein N-terminal amidase Nta1 n=1 Tax=Fimicolochytrium jonesii TaxID=1396493 RepID=UPI0022FDF1B6|nr:protein N-terminal amidase Nta1 [Fimicolochytrium jonesii]KAI8826692.1 protein N-terminal amidase Nta1 [Fimicolochytrium jonesii]